MRWNGETWLSRRQQVPLAAGGFEGARDLDDAPLVEELADDLQAYGQAVAESGHITDAYRDPAGHPHDLVFLRVPLGRSWQWARW